MERAEHKMLPYPTELLDSVYGTPFSSAVRTFKGLLEMTALQ